MIEQEYPLIGTGVWVRKEGKVLLAKRAAQKKAGAGEWSPPGGHFEMFETIEECAIRETHEETSIEIANLRFIRFFEIPRPEKGTHYVTFHYVADWLSGEPRPQEGESEEWHWFAWNELPQPLFVQAEVMLGSGFNPLEF